MTHRQPHRAFAAVFVTFLVNGALLGTWVARIPEIQTKLGLSEAGLGIVLLGMSVGVLVGLSLAGGWVARFGSRAVTTLGFLAMCFLLPGLSWAPNPVALWILLFLFGGAMSVMDVAMTVARLSGDHLKAHFSLVNMIRAGGWIAGSGLVLVVLSNNAILTFIGFAIVGLGLANIIPIAFTAAGNYPGVPSGTGIAAVATIGYAGFLAGPPLIGLLAEATSLKAAFCLLIAILAVLPWIAHTVSVAK